MQKTIGKQIFLGGLVGIAFGVVWDQLTPLPYFVIGLGIISLISGTVFWVKNRQKELLVTETSIEPIAVDIAYVFWGIGLIALVVFFVCRHFSGFSLANILPEHLQDSIAMKIVFLLGVGWVVLGIGFFTHFCWVACRAMRVPGRVTSFATQEKTTYHHNVQSMAKYYAEVVSYYMGDKERQVTGVVWMPFEPEMGKTHTVWVNRKNWDKAYVYPSLVFWAFGVFGVLGLLILGFVFYVA